jgi:hypothetical protein
MTGDTMKSWTEVHFLPILGYEPKCLTLAKGWLAWITREVADATKLLLSGGVGVHQELFLKKWLVDFDAHTEILAITMVWVFLPSLPLILWSEEVFKEIRNSLGFFYEAHTSYKTLGYMGMV